MKNGVTGMPEKTTGQIIKKICALAVLSLMLCAGSVPSELSAYENSAAGKSAPEKNEAEKSDGRISLECGVPGMKWDIYRVADANEDGTLTPDERFSGYGIPVSYSHREEIQNLARTFESYIVSKGEVPYGSCAADENGNAVFTELEEGWYTAVPSKLEADDTVYESASVMVCVSSFGIYSDVWGENVRICPKIIRSTKKPENKKKIIIKYEPDPSQPERKDPIEIIIYRNNEKYNHVILDPDNDWTYVFPDMPDDDTNWTIIQKDVPENVISLYHRETDRTDGTPVDTLILRHKWHFDNSVLNPDMTLPVVSDKPDRNPEVTEVSENMTPENTQVTSEVTVPATEITEESSLPQTGQLWWPVPLLAAFGAVFTAAGAVLRSKGGDE